MTNELIDLDYGHTDNTVMNMMSLELVVVDMFQSKIPYVIWQH